MVGDDRQLRVAGELGEPLDGLGERAGDDDRVAVAALGVRVNGLRGAGQVDLIADSKVLRVGAGARRHGLASNALADLSSCPHSPPTPGRTHSAIGRLAGPARRAVRCRSGPSHAAALVGYSINPRRIASLTAAARSCAPSFS